MGYMSKLTVTTMALLKLPSSKPTNLIEQVDGTD